MSYRESHLHLVRCPFKPKAALLEGPPINFR